MLTCGAKDASQRHSSLAEALRTLFWHPAHCCAHFKPLSSFRQGGQLSTVLKAVDIKEKNSSLSHNKAHIAVSVNLFVCRRRCCSCWQYTNSADWHSSWLVFLSVLQIRCGAAAVRKSNRPCFSEMERCNDGACRLMTAHYPLFLALEKLSCWKNRGLEAGKCLLSPCIGIAV